jgi:hypothetical protein
MLETRSVRASQAAELTRLARSIRDAAEAIGEAMYHLSDLAPSLPHAESVIADNNSRSLLELGIGLEVQADSLEAAAGSLSVGVATGADDDEGVGGGE